MLQTYVCPYEQGVKIYHHLMYMKSVIQTLVAYVDAKYRRMLLQYP